MDMEGVKIYGLCLERLKYQIRNARCRLNGGASVRGERLLLECYNTGDIDDIIDILELYDVNEKTRHEVSEKLEELSYTVSALTRETLLFDYTDDGHLGLYLGLQAKPVDAVKDEVACLAYSTT